MLPVPWYLGVTREASPMSAQALSPMRAIERLDDVDVSWS